MKTSALLVVVVAAFAATSEASPAAVCWKDTTDRGVGKPIHACGAGQQEDAGLCYPACKATYYGVGPVCWQHCKPGYVDEGALCRKSGSIVTYAKATYGRGVGKPLGCAADESYDAGLCYPPCGAGYVGVGPVCWEACPAVNPVAGGAICCRDGSTCSSKIVALAGGLPLAVLEALLSGGNATKIEEAVLQALDSVLGYVMPKCDSLAAGRPAAAAVTARAYPFAAAAAKKKNLLVGSGPKCPGSKSFIHAKCSMTVAFKAACAVVQAEMVARIDGQAAGAWSDPHNNGTYAVVSQSAAELDTTRVTGPGTPHYMDKQTFTFAAGAGGAGCEMTACSESQVTSVVDYSTNYCDLHDLHAGAGVKTTLHGQETLVSCSQHDASKCIKS